nr:hypothetical protein [Tanacetum cinerariifolium]
YRNLEAGTRSEFSKLEEAERRDVGTSEAALRAQYEQFNRDALAAITARDSAGTSNCARRIKEILDGGRLLVTLQERIDSIRRLQKAKRLFDSRAYKDWL